jgi:hypothetical protein
MAGYSSTAAEFDAMTPSMEATNDAREPEPVVTPPRKTKVAVMKYQFGSYDYDGVKEEWRIPEFEEYEVQGFFYANKGVLKDEDVEDMKAYGWQAVIIDLAPGTPFVASERVTSKITKWGVPEELRAYDFVLTHDCDVYADYKRAIPYMVGHMEEHHTAALFQRH